MYSPLRPRPGASQSPSMPRSIHLFLHNFTVLILHPHRCASAAFLNPSAGMRTIVARFTVRCSVLPARTKASKPLRLRFTQNQFPSPGHQPPHKELCPVHNTNLQKMAAYSRDRALGSQICFYLTEHILAQNRRCRDS